MFKLIVMLLLFESRRRLVVFLWVVMALFLLYGCATPSKKITEETYNDDGVLQTRRVELEYDNSTIWDGKIIGMKIAYDINSYSPSVWFMYGRTVAARIRRGQKLKNVFKTKNMNLLSLTGETSHDVGIVDDPTSVEAGR